MPPVHDKTLSDNQDESAVIASIQSDVSWIKQTMTRMEGQFVSHAEFVPVKMIAYGMIGIVMLAVLSTLMTLLLGAHKP
jgi:hypothetical protein